ARASAKKFQKELSERDQHIKQQNPRVRGAVPDTPPVNEARCSDTSSHLRDIISYCTADKTQDKVFAYVSQSQFNETLECHAFLCQKKKIAQAVTLTVAQAFKVALDLWEIAQEDKSKKARTCCSCAASKGQTQTAGPQCVPSEQHKPLVMEEKLRRPFFSASLSSPSPRSNPTRRRPIKHDSWDVDDGLDDPFSRLAKSCSQPVSDHADLSPWEVYNHNLLIICNNEFE
ncbi:hypothetical protein KUCAC02_019885, partial [Chaenocephalus aceratus]